MWIRFGSNALANVLTGGSSVVFQLGLTAMATQSFDANSFAVWTLALSMANLTPLFAVNLSAVVTRQLVPTLASGGTEIAALVMTTARRIGLGLGALAVFVILLAAMGLHRASQSLHATGNGTFAVVVLLLTVGQLWQITMQPTFGWHYAREQNWPVVGALLLVRTCALVAMWVATRNYSGDLLATAFCLSLGYWFGVALAHRGSFRPTTVPHTAGPQLTHQLRETALLLRWFAVWSICLMAIQYGLPQVMSILGAAHYNAFYLAYSLNLILTGVVGAIGSAMLAPIARLKADSDRNAMVQSLTFLPALVALLLILILGGLRLAMPRLVTYWSHGIAPAEDVNAYLFLLGFQTIARSLSVVFGIVLASRATAFRLVGTVLIELAVVLLIAVPLGGLFGERPFLLGLAGAGLTGAIATAIVGTGVAGLKRPDRRHVLTRFVATEIAALAIWWILAE